VGEHLGPVLAEPAVARDLSVEKRGVGEALALRELGKANPVVQPLRQLAVDPDLNRFGQVTQPIADDSGDNLLGLLVGEAGRLDRGGDQGDSRSPLLEAGVAEQR